MTDQVANEEEILANARLNVLNNIHRRRRAFSLGVVGGALVVALSVTGAALVVQQMSNHEAATTVVCYAHDDVNSLSGTVGVSNAVATSGDGASSTPQTMNKPEACGLIWREGLAEAAANGGHWPKIDPNASTLPVPAIAFCVMTNGETAGFPIEAPSTTVAEVCDNLGLAVDTTVSR